MPLPLVLTETVLTFAEAVAYCPLVAGKRPSAKTVYVWADSGVKVGQARVKLETARVGGRRVTSKESLDRFFAASAPPPPQIRTPAQRRAASEAARKHLHEQWAKMFPGRKKKQPVQAPAPAS